MDYYERKKKTLEIIDGLLDKGVFSREDIQIAVLKNTFLGKKFVDDYINSCILRGVAVIDKNTSVIKLKDINKGVEE